MNDMTALLPHIKLRFNIEHPSFEECYTYGYECAMAEVSEEENPFRPGSKESEYWLEGWWAGFYQEEPLFDLATVDGNINLATAEQPEAANDHVYYESLGSFFTKVMEISGLLAVSAAVGYQVIDLVA